MNILKIINEILDQEELEKLNKLDPSISLTKDLKMDSMMLAELTVKIEEETGIDIFENGVVGTIGEILEILNM